MTGRYVAHPTDKLSPGALELKKLVFDEGRKLSDVLREKPELLDSVDEYNEWYGENLAAISESKETPATGHSAKKAAEKLKRQPK